MARGSGTSLAPGFRFHPTDEELVRYYLTRKVSGRSFRFDAISEVDVYKNEPWDLPSKSMLKTRDLEWYFFSMLDKKYGNGWRTNRATEKGYWKTTGKDRPVYHKSRIVGMKKTLVYHCGRAPRGQRSNWVMHEYRLTDEELEKAGIAQDAFVLCRIFQKSGPGPKNGERYGAPFVEEEWENDDAATCFPGGELPVDDNVALGDDAYFDVDDLDKPLDPTEDVPIPPSFYYGETSNHNDDSRDINVYDQKPVIGSLDSHRCSDLGCNSKLNDSPGHIIDPITSYHEYVDESEMMNPLEADYLLDEPYLDVADNASLGSELFLEANDFSNSMKADTTKLDTVDEYLTFFDEGNGDLNNIGSDSKQMAEAERAISDQEPLVKKDASEENEQVSMPNGHLSDANENDGASSSKQISEAEKHKSDMDYPFIKKTGHLLESMSHPSVFAPEFASKDAVLRINSTSQSSSSVHVTAGVIRISNFTISDGQTDWPLNKNMDVNIVLSFSLPQGFGSPNWLRLTDVLSSKTGPSALSVFWYFMFFWVLILSISFKVGTLACA